LVVIGTVMNIVSGNNNILNIRKLF
jgi:hypothetical protein